MSRDVYLFWDARHSAPGRARDLGNELADRLREGGFSVERMLVEDLRPVPAVCAIGRPQGGMNMDRNTVSRSMFPALSLAQILPATKHRGRRGRHAGTLRANRG